MRELTLGHSPDPDDAFMFYALAAGRINTGALRFRHILQDIETLNRRALKGELDITALSLHAYAFVLDRYALLPSGASMGDGYGPIVIARTTMSVADLAHRRIAVPGELTTAFLALKLLQPHIEHEVLPFDRIIEAVEAGRNEAGLLIHEGQITYAARGLQKVVDLGEWWRAETGLPLPLGVNVVRKDLGASLMRDVSRYLSESIAYGLMHREEAVRHAQRYGRDLDAKLTDRFVGMYVNDLTVDYGERGRHAVRLLLDRAHEASLIPRPVELEFV
ncbi:MAG: MqnA/MqnD/SBP family protein [Planctomycetota bacterium]